MQASGCGKRPPHFQVWWVLLLCDHGPANPFRHRGSFCLGRRGFISIINMLIYVDPYCKFRICFRNVSDLPKQWVPPIALWHTGRNVGISPSDSHMNSHKNFSLFSCTIMRSQSQAPVLMQSSTKAPQFRGWGIVNCGSKLAGFAHWRWSSYQGRGAVPGFCTM